VRKEGWWGRSGGGGERGRQGVEPAGCESMMLDGNKERGRNQLDS